MKIDDRHIGYWLCSLMMLFCISCGSSNDEDTGGGGSENPEVKAPSKIEIHVYTPENPIVTRDAVYVDPTAEERAVNKLDIWVFEHHDPGDPDDGKFVGYLSPQVAQSFEGGTYQMTVSDAFSENPPRVDVFVIANVSSDLTGFSLGTGTTRAQLEEALIQGSYFGLTTPQTTVPAGGLPMSGVLKNQELEGEAPVLRVAPVKVVRSVSKIRFIFSRTDTGDNDELKINSISLNDGMIPAQEYLFLNGPYTPDSYRIKGDTYTGGALTPLTDADHIKPCAYPAKYAYTDELAGQDYEKDLINPGIADGDLTQVGQFYLRESDRPLKGTIKYQFGAGAEKTAGFTMSEPGEGEPGEFTRNHTWIIYGYFAGQETLKVSSVVFKDWITTADDQIRHPVYNW